MDGFFRPPPPLADLMRAAAETETLFLRVGEHLGQAATALGSVTEMFATLRDRLERPEILDAVASLEQAAAGIGIIGRNNAGDLAELMQMEAKTGMVRSRLARLCKTIADVRLLSINARIESALVSNTAVDFSVFTHEIGRLSTLAEEGLGQLGEELSALDAVVGNARHGQQSFEQTRRDSLGVVQERISRSLNSAEAHRHQAAEAATAIAHGASQVGARVGAAVMALQIGDISRQRVEHVCQSLEELGDPAANLDLSGEERSTLAARVYRLQAVQLTQTAAELESGAATARANLQALAEESARVEGMGGRVFGGSEDGHGSFLLDLAEQLREAEALMRAYAAARTHTEALVHAVSERVAAMVNHVQAVHSIEIDLRIMGLNATLKCNRLGGDGRVLSVIAQTLRTYAGSTVADAADLMDGLEGTIAAARGLGARSGSGEGEADTLTGLTALMNGSAGILHATGTDMAGALETLVTAMSQIAGRLSESALCLDQVGAVAASLKTAAAGLTEAAGEGGDDGLSDQVLEQLTGRYTMAREREAHLLHVHGAGAASMAPEPAMVSVDDCLF